MEAIVSGMLVYFFIVEPYLQYRKSRIVARLAKEQYERILEECEYNEIWLNQWTRGYDGTLKLPTLKESKCK